MSNLIRRFGFAIGSILLVHALAFFMMHTTRGGPFDGGRELPPDTLAALESRYGLDAPLIEQYFAALKGVIILDFGPSLQYQGVPVQRLLLDAIPTSLGLGFGALLIAIACGLGAGVHFATTKSRWQKWTATAVSSSLLATPNFVIAGLLISVFAFKLGMFPVARNSEPLSLVLPCLALGLPLAAQLFILVQHHSVQAINSSAYKSAKARGLTGPALRFNYIVRPSLTPVLAFLGPATAGILTGSLVIEQIFSLPGLGTFFVQAALARDYTLALGVTVTYTATLAVCTLIADLLIMKFDPRNESV